MSKLGGFLARKPASGHKATLTQQSPAQSQRETVSPARVAQDIAPLDLDEELFSALGAQLGSENEALRNLLLNANEKISELDSIKDAVGKLVDPVSKALRDFESEKSEKVSLQTILNNTRAAYGKLRNEITEVERKAAAFERDAAEARRDLQLAHNTVRTLEQARGELAIDIAARRAQIAELEGRLAQEQAETKALRDETRRLNDRHVTNDKRIVQLEADLNAARQKLVLSDDEKRSVQSSLDKAVAECARLSRRLAEAEGNYTTVQGRLRLVEGNLAEVISERGRLSHALDEVNERHQGELTTQQMRYEALQARATATERLLDEAREQLTARAEEIRAFDRRLSETAQDRDTLAARLAASEGERIQRESEFKESEQARSLLLERSSALAKAFNSKEASLTRAEENVRALTEKALFLEKQLQNVKQSSDQRIEDLDAALRREKVERSVVEGALEAARKDFARLMRELMALERQKNGEAAEPTPQAANAA
jgi:crescentin